MPLREALRYICELAHVKFKLEDYAISIVPFNHNTDELISRTFLVGPNFVALTPWLAARKFHLP